MESIYEVNSRAGPSNYANQYVHQPRPVSHHGSGRGRGQNDRRHPNGMYQHNHRQYYDQTPHNSYSRNMGGVSNAGLRGRTSYGHHPQNALSPGRRGHANYQTPSPTAIPTPHMYAPLMPYFPSMPQSNSPVLHYPSNAQLSPFPHAFTSPPPPAPPHQHPYPISNHTVPKSPPISPLQEQILSSPIIPKAYSPSHQFQQSIPSLLSPLQVTQGPEHSLISVHENGHSLVPSMVEEVSLNPGPFPGEAQANSSNADSIEVSLEEDIPAPLQEWVITDYRPDNPTDAFGIMISPKAKPPLRIIETAVEYTPPMHFKSIPPRPMEDIMVVDIQPKVQNESEQEVKLTSRSPDEYGQVSSSTTETESRASTAPDMFIPGSPQSTNTSVSLAPKTNSINGKDLREENAVVSAVSNTGTIPPEIEPPGPTSKADVQVPSTPAIPKKSWASLLRTGDSQNSSKSSLPTSSVVGFSVPAAYTGGISSSGSSNSVSRDGLLHLLANGPNGTTLPQIRPRGLINTGNMCFANAVLQTLVYCQPFYRLFSELGRYLSSGEVWPTKADEKSIPLVEATIEFLNEFKPKERDNIDGQSDEDYDGIDSFVPAYVYDALKEKSRFDSMRGGHQEDAEEFFGFFLDTLEEEIISISETIVPRTQSGIQSEKQTNTDDGWLEVGKKNKFVVTRSTKANDSSIRRIFGGKYRSTLRVPGQRDSVVVEDWRSMQLDVQREQVKSIEDALRFISHPQSVQVSSVTKGGTVVDASQQVLVDDLPSILVLHLKRFLYDTAAKGVVKISKQVTFGPELEFPLDVISPVRRPMHPIKYKLFAVLYHHGQSAAGGHYTLDVLHPSCNPNASGKGREGWIRIDDELVSDLRVQDVFKSNVDDRCAYLLFYRRVSRAGQTTA